MASGAAVAVAYDPEEEARPQKTLTKASAVAISYLKKTPEAQWARSCMILFPGAHAEWVTVSDQTDGEYLDGTFDFAHGSILEVHKAEVKAEGDIAHVSGEIKAEVQEGYPDAKVSREVLADDDVMDAYNALAEQYTE